MLCLSSLFFLLQRTELRHFIFLLSRDLTVLEHKTVTKLQNEVTGLRAEKAQLEGKCFSQEIEIELTQTNTDPVGENANFSE